MAKKNLLLLIILSLVFTIIVGIGLDVVRANNVALDLQPQTKAELELLSLDLRGNDTLLFDLNRQLTLPKALNLESRQLLNLGSKPV